MSKNYKTKISWDSAKSLVSFADSRGCPISCYGGSLLDNYVIYNARCIKINKAKPRTYIILQEVYVNAWSSAIELILTDDENQVNKFINQFDSVDEDE